jgi:hypothetical protein
MYKSVVGSWFLVLYLLILAAFQFSKFCFPTHLSKPLVEFVSAGSEKGRHNPQKHSGECPGRTEHSNYCPQSLCGMDTYQGFKKLDM